MIVLLMERMNNMKFDDFIKLEIKRASKNEWFDIEGNSPLAMSNRGFISELKKQIKGFNYDILQCVDFKELTWQLAKLILFVTIPITYIPFLLARTCFSRRSAKNEMRVRYNNFKVEEIHK